MKVMKKIAAVVLAVCLMVPFISIQADAAEGTLMFSDPQTKVGENVSVDLVVQSGGATIGDVEVVMNYDSTALEFISGTEVTSDGAGTLTYSHTGTGSETELRTTMEFRALKQGEANITVSGHTAYLYSDETLTLSEGSSVVTIDVGADGSTSVEAEGNREEGKATAAATDVKVNVDGVEYSLSEAFTVAMIPEGYTETKLTYDGAERKFVTNETGVKLGYLVDAAGEANFFLYNEENATFAPFVEIHISETTSIILLNDPDEVKLSENYQLAELQVGDYTFPAWQDMEHDSYYAMYALNTSTGQKEVYQYDTVDGTYQRLIETKSEEKEETLEDGDTVLGKMKNFVYKNFMIFVIVSALIGLIILIVLIVVAVKLYRRNAELDDLYDEYDILDDTSDKPKTSKKSREQFAGYDEEEDEFGDEDDFLEDDYDDGYDYDDEDDYDYDYEDDDDEFFNDGDESETSKGQKDKNNAYNIDFIDL